MDCLQEQRKDKLRKLINECELDNPYEILYEEVRKKITEINMDIIGEKISRRVASQKSI